MQKIVSASDKSDEKMVKLVFKNILLCTDREKKSDKNWIWNKMLRALEKNKILFGLLGAFEINSCGNTYFVLLAATII